MINAKQRLERLQQYARHLLNVSTAKEIRWKQDWEVSAGYGVPLPNSFTPPEGSEDYIKHAGKWYSRLKPDESRRRWLTTYFYNPLLQALDLPAPWDSGLDSIAAPIVCYVHTLLTRIVDLELQVEGQQRETGRLLAERQRWEGRCTELDAALHLAAGERTAACTEAAALRAQLADTRRELDLTRTTAAGMALALRAIEASGRPHAPGTALARPTPPPDMPPAPNGATMPEEAQE